MLVRTLLLCRVTPCRAGGTSAAKVRATQWARVPLGEPDHRDPWWWIRRHPGRAEHDEGDPTEVRESVQQVADLEVRVAVAPRPGPGPPTEQGIGLVEEQNGPSSLGVVEDRGEVLLGLADPLRHRVRQVDGDEIRVHVGRQRRCVRQPCPPVSRRHDHQPGTAGRDAMRCQHPDIVPASSRLPQHSPRPRLTCPKTSGSSLAGDAPRRGSPRGCAPSLRQSSGPSSIRRRECESTVSEHPTSPRPTPRPGPHGCGSRCPRSSSSSGCSRARASRAPSHRTPRGRSGPSWPTWSSESSSCRSAQSS